MAEIGSIIDGKYEILTELGHGGMSVVYLAMDRRLKKQWAVKEAKKKPPGQSNIVGLTPVSEAEMLTKLNHPILCALWTLWIKTIRSTLLRIL